MLGIDVSVWQGDIDFQKVKDAGVEFVFIRVGSQRGVDGEYYIDAIDDRGVKVGSKECEEGKMFLIPQIWSVFSGVSRCGREITAGQEYWACNGSRVCPDCLPEFARQELAPCHKTRGKELYL